MPAPRVQINDGWVAFTEREKEYCGAALTKIVGGPVVDMRPTRNCWIGQTRSFGRVRWELLRNDPRTSETLGRSFALSLSPGRGVKFPPVVLVGLIALPSARAEFFRGIWPDVEIHQPRSRADF